MSAHLKKSGPGLKKVTKELLAKLDGTHVVVGVLGQNAERPGEQIDNVGLAIVHEFGLGVPERSFLRSTFDMRKEQWLKFAHRVLRAAAHGRLDVTAALQLIGEKMKTDVKSRITAGAGIPPPLAPATVAAKGSSRPLIDTGRLVASIDYDVRSKRG